MYRSLGKKFFCSHRIKESRLSLTPPNVLTREEFMEVYNASPYGKTCTYTLKGLREFVEECFRSKKMYELEQEVYFEDRKYKIVGKQEVLGEETTYTLKSSKGTYSHPIKESRLSLTVPNALTFGEFMEVYKASEKDVLCHPTLVSLHEFVEECIRSKKCIN